MDAFALTGRLRGGAWVVVAVAASVLTAVVVTHLPSHGLVLNAEGLFAMVVVAVTVFPVARRIANHTIDVFEPIVWGCAMLLALFGIRPLVMLANQDITFQDMIDVHQGFPRAVLLGMLGTVAFVVSYEAWPRIRRQSQVIRERVRLDAQASRQVVFWLVAIGGLLYFARLASAGNPLSTLKLLAAGRSVTSDTATSSSYLDDSPMLLSCAATIYILARHGQLVRRERFALAALVILPILAFSLLGNRRLIIPSVATPIITYYLVVQRRPRWRTLALILPVAFIILATIPFERSLGARQNTKGGATGIFENAFTQPFAPIGTFFSGLDTEMVGALALEVDTLKKPSDYYYGDATVGDLILSPVPSALVPGKPLSARNGFLVRIFGLPCVGEAGAQCPDFSVVGTFYQDFWIPGAVIGMILFGVFSSALWCRYREQPYDPLRIVLAASWAVSVPVIIRAGFMPAFQWWLEFLVPTWIGLRFIQSHAAPAPSPRSRIPTRAPNVTSP